MNNFRSECFNMINKIIRDKRDGNEYYTTDQFKASIKFYEEEKKRIQQEKISQQEKEEKLRKANEELIRRNKDLEIAAQNAARDFERLANQFFIWVKWPWSWFRKKINVAF